MPETLWFWTPMGEEIQIVFSSKYQFKFVCKYELSIAIGVQNQSVSHKMKHRATCPSVRIKHRARCLRHSGFGHQWGKKYKLSFHGNINSNLYVNMD